MNENEVDPIEFHEFIGAPWIYLDTQIVTLFAFAEDPDSFMPIGANNAVFVIAPPVLRELEKIKDEHWSKGQRARVRSLLEKLDPESVAKDQANYGARLTPRSILAYRPSEPPGAAYRTLTPYEQFVDCAAESAQYNAGPIYVLSDDVGVRVRAHQNPKITVLRPSSERRYADENYNLPQVLKTMVRELAREIAVEVRLLEEGASGP